MFISWFIIFVLFFPVLFVSVSNQANSNDLDFEWIISMMCLLYCVFQALCVFLSILPCCVVYFAFCFVFSQPLCLSL